MGGGHFIPEKGTETARRKIGDQGEPHQGHGLRVKRNTSWVPQTRKRGKGQQKEEVGRSPRGTEDSARKEKRGVERLDRSWGG